jgi:hypothetical protein
LPETENLIPSVPEDNYMSSLHLEENENWLIKKNQDSRKFFKNLESEYLRFVRYVRIVV